LMLVFFSTDSMQFVSVCVPLWSIIMIDAVSIGFIPLAFLLGVTFSRMLNLYDLSRNIVPRYWFIVILHDEVS
jgi:hypothetical protein